MQYIIGKLPPEYKTVLEQTLQRQKLVPNGIKYKDELFIPQPLIKETPPKNMFPLPDTSSNGFISILTELSCLSHHKKTIVIINNPSLDTEHMGLVLSTFPMFYFIIYGKKYDTQNENVMYVTREFGKDDAKQYNIGCQSQNAIVFIDMTSTFDTRESPYKVANAIATDYNYFHELKIILDPDIAMRYGPLPTPIKYKPADEGKYKPMGGREPIFNGVVIRSTPLAARLLHYGGVYYNTTTPFIFMCVEHRDVAKHYIPRVFDFDIIYNVLNNNQHRVTNGRWVHPITHKEINYSDAIILNAVFPVVNFEIRSDGICMSRFIERVNHWEKVLSEISGKKHKSGQKKHKSGKKKHKNTWKPPHETQRYADTAKETIRSSSSWRKSL
jgi:hypothetical protein